MCGKVGLSGSPIPRLMMSTPQAATSFFTRSISANTYGGSLRIRSAGRIFTDTLALSFVTTVYAKPIEKPLLSRTLPDAQGERAFVYVGRLVRLRSCAALAQERGV